MYKLLSSLNVAWILVVSFMGIFFNEYISLLICLCLIGSWIFYIFIKKSCGSHAAATEKEIWNKKLLLAFVPLFLFILILSCSFAFFKSNDLNMLRNNSEEAHLMQQSNETSNYVIGEHQGIRTQHYFDYAVSDDSIYFTYNKSSIIDIYDYKGLFQYSILLPNKNDGTLTVRYENDFLYVRAKDKTVYVFDGENCIEFLSPQEAEAAGYTYDWFCVQPNTKIEKAYIYWLDDHGTQIAKISTPSVVQSNWPSEILFSTSTISLTFLISVAFVISLFCILYVLLKRRIEKKTGDGSLS